MDLLFDWFGLVCFANKNKICQLSYSLFQTSQTGGQLYSDTSTYSIPWLGKDNWPHLPHSWPGLEPRTVLCCQCCQDFFFVTYTAQSKLKCLCLASLSSPVKYLRGNCPYYKSLARLERYCRDKHSSLFGLFVTVDAPK